MRVVDALLAHSVVTKADLHAPRGSTATPGQELLSAIHEWGLDSAAFFVQLDRVKRRT